MPSLRKDIGIVLDETRDSGARLLLAALVEQLCAEVQSTGDSRWDASSLLARLQRQDQSDLWPIPDARTNISLCSRIYESGFYFVTAGLSLGL